MQVMYILLNSIIQTFIISNPYRYNWQHTFINIFRELIDIFFVDGLDVFEVALDGLEGLAVVEYDVLG